MKPALYILVVSFLLLAIVGVGEGKKNEANNTSFINLLNDAYKIQYKGRGFITGYHFDRKTCVYGETPNIISKKIIHNMYELMIKEFDVFHLPVYVKELTECPSSSNFFILLHESLYDQQTKIKQLNKVEVFLGRTIRKNVKLASGLASTYTMYNRGSFIFIEIDQLTNYLNNHIYRSLLKALIKEELMQGFSGGNDLNIRTIRMSLLQEPHFTQLPYTDSYLQKKIGSKWHMDFYKKMMKAKPTGFCSFDLWFLELARIAKKKDYILYEDYIGLWNEENEMIKTKIKKIERDQNYSELIDPRCSGKNAGENTKIGHERYY